MKNLVLSLIVLLVITGCASTIEPTPVPTSAGPAPVQLAPSQQVSPVSQTAPTQPPPPPSKCQSKITGRVLDAKGNIAKGATVTVKSGSFTAKTLSDDNGLYGFAGLCGGTYSFTVQLSGQAAKAVAADASVDGNNSAKADLNVK